MREPPIIRRYPWLAALPRAGLLGALPTPVERSGAAESLWVKRDDLSATGLGGNKVRALDWLLGGVGAGDTVVTVGGAGSTHALATVRHAHRLGARAEVLRWRQEMNDAAERVGARLCAEGDACADARTVAGVYARALVRRARARVRGERLRWIPAGGTTPLGILGHVDAALELAAQVAAGVMPAPARVVLPLGSGGTAAGLALGFAIAGLETDVVGVQVVPVVVARRGRVLGLAAATARLIERLDRANGGTTRVPRPSPSRVRVERLQYGGAYGRETAAGRAAARRFAEHHAARALDATYSAKAFAAALAACDGKPTLFWLTYDEAATRDQGPGSGDEDSGPGSRSGGRRSD